MNNKDTALLTGSKSAISSQSVKKFFSYLVSRREFVVTLFFIIISTFLSLWTDTFLTINNLSNLARNFSWIAIVAFGQSMVIIIGGLDMSVGAIMALAGLITAYSMQADLPLPLAITAGLLTGGAVGLINGLIIARAKLSPFVVTLGTMSITRGIAFSLTGGWPVRDLSQGFRAMGQHDIPLGVCSLPVPVLFMLGTAVVVSFLLDRMVLGTYIRTLSNSERALLITGVNTVQITVLVYTLCGLLAAFGGLLMTARLGVAAPTAATGYELDTIAAAVVGGTSLYGGVGSVWGVLLGAAVLQTLRNGLVLLGFPAYGQTLAIGATILGVILLDYWRRQH